MKTNYFLVAAMLWSTHICFAQIGTQDQLKYAQERISAFEKKTESIRLQAIADFRKERTAAEADLISILKKLDPKQDKANWEQVVKMKDRAGNALLFFSAEQRLTRDNFLDKLSDLEQLAYIQNSDLTVCLAIKKMFDELAKGKEVKPIAVMMSHFTITDTHLWNVLGVPDDIAKVALPGAVDALGKPLEGRVFWYGEFGFGFLGNGLYMIQCKQQAK